MLNKLQVFIRKYALLQPGDTLYCAVSGGADSMALLWAMYLLREKLDIRLSAAHFNHRLRGEESDRDEVFVRTFCQDYQIPFHAGSAQVVPGKKGLEAAARDARYAFLQSLPGVVATAHTANDNAETMLMHLVRGTGLKGLGGIAPKRGKLIRPMLSVTRQEALAFLAEYSIPYVQDSSNDTDVFLRNRLRHNILPLLEQENPSLAQNLSATALRLRMDEQALEEAARVTDDVNTLRLMPQAVRRRVLAKLLVQWGVREPEAEHIAAVERLVMCESPSAGVDLPAGVRVRRNYGRLEKADEKILLLPTELNCPGVTEFPELGMKVVCRAYPSGMPGGIPVRCRGTLVARARQPGDTIRLPGGSKSLKKLFIDRKIPAAHRDKILVVWDDDGIVAVQGIGPDLDRSHEPNIEICFETV